MAEQHMPSDRTIVVPDPAAPPKRRSGKLLMPIAVILAAGILVVLFATRWDSWIGGQSRQTTDDAYIRGDITPLSAEIEGPVRRVAVTDYQRVEKGDLLVEIDDSNYRARLAQAEADLLGAQAAIENLKTRKALQHAKVAEAENAIAGSAADVERTQQESARQRALVASTFGTRQRLEQAVADQRRFAAAFAGKQSELDAERRDMAVLDTQELQLRAEYKAKAALVDLARIDLGYARITAPVGGVVSERGVRPGQYVHAGTQVISVVPLDTVWVVANYNENQLTHVAPGQKALVRVDTFPGVTIAATVAAIAPASGSQFSLLPPDNATGNFTKVVQRIPVKLTIAPGNPLAGELRPGMSVTATILTDSPQRAP